MIGYAEEHNEPGRFTAFIGYEWSAMPAGNNLHRVVVLRDDADKASHEETGDRPRFSNWKIVVCPLFLSGQHADQGALQRGGWLHATRHYRHRGGRGVGALGGGDDSGTRLTQAGRIVVKNDRLLCRCAGFISTGAGDLCRRDPPCPAHPVLTQKANRLTLVTKRRLKPFFHDCGNDGLYRSGIIDMREFNIGHRQLEEIAERLPTISHFKDQ